MKMLLILVCLLFCLFLSCESSHDQLFENRPAAKAVEDLLYRTEQSFEKKYKIRTIGTNIGMPGNVIGILGLQFQMLGPRSKKEIRNLLINLAQEFRLFVNNDEAVRPYLKNYPFELENIQIILFFNDSKGYEIDNPNIGIAQISYGKLVYRIMETTDIPRVINEYEESYEEALKAAEAQPNN